MNLHSCKKCGVVIDQDKIKFIDSEVPDDPKEEVERDEDGDFPPGIETSFNPDCIWPRGNCCPLDTWKCPVCGEFNAKGED